MFGLRITKVANNVAKPMKIRRSVSVYTTPQGVPTSVDYIVSSEREALIEKNGKNLRDTRLNILMFKLGTPL